MGQNSFVIAILILIVITAAKDHCQITVAVIVAIIIIITFEVYLLFDYLIQNFINRKDSFIKINTIKASERKIIRRYDIIF